jgi:hypothetical protein
MAAYRFVAVVGARVLPESVAPQVAAVVQFFLSRGWGIGSGGVWGADAFALHTVVGAGSAACARSVVFLPGAAVRPARRRAWCLRHARRARDGWRGVGACGAPRSLAAAGARLGGCGRLPLGAVAGLGVHGAGSHPGGEAGRGGPRRRRGGVALILGRRMGAVFHRIGRGLPLGGRARRGREALAQDLAGAGLRGSRG